MDTEQLEYSAEVGVNEKKEFKEELDINKLSFEQLQEIEKLARITLKPTEDGFVTIEGKTVGL